MTQPALVIERATVDFEPAGDGWTIIGRAVPFGKPHRVSDDGGRSFYQEEFDPHSFDRDVSNGGRWVNLYVGHRGDDGDRFLGRALGLRAEPDGLWAEVRLNRNHKHAEAARAGELRGWSVGCRVYRTQTLPNGTRRRMACGLNHIAATPAPQYEGAGVVLVRDSHVTDSMSTPRLDHWRGLLTR